MTTVVNNLPSLPDLGLSESHYTHAAHQASRAGNVHAHEAAKVGQYITLGINDKLTWEEKLKCFRHALKRHCQCPPMSDPPVEQFYADLTAMVRRYAAEEAMKIASRLDDHFATMLKIGRPRSEITRDAEEYFLDMIPRECPEWFNEDDYNTLRIIRDQWI